jgi:hypothetical protein
LDRISCPFCSDYFGDGILQAICPGWSWTTILLFSVSHITKIAAGATNKNTIC